MPGLYCNATVSFGAFSGIQVIGFSVVRRCDPNFSAADLSSRITYVAAKNCVDILTCTVLDPSVLSFVQGQTGALSFVAKTADGGADLTFAGPATLLNVEGEVVFADVNSPCSVTWAIISTDGQTPDLGVT